MNHVLAAVPLTTVGCGCCCVCLRTYIYNTNLFIKQDIYKQRALSTMSHVTVSVHRKELRLGENQNFTANNVENETIYLHWCVEQVCYCRIWLEYLAS